LADPVLAGGSIPYGVVAEVADEDDWVDVILDAGRDHGCDHVFGSGKCRSPAGKPVLGDTAQQVIRGSTAPLPSVPTSEPPSRATEARPTV
jgi:hypothetical protein